MRDEANARRTRPANRAGCKPIEDVCVEHDMPLVCRHGCSEAISHAKDGGPLTSKVLACAQAPAEEKNG